VRVQGLDIVVVKKKELKINITYHYKFLDPNLHYSLAIRLQLQVASINQSSAT
jgi:hypothetical protein